ncbi:MAG: DUF4129 domain-containing protein [Bacteroidia bacterium]|nr:DUF4129 domain-containing protein [Bacteroidia bacterium]NNK59016.1 DUF4129 domain-containing protein [Flavobacteriaceae bacterium]NNL32564.1 DUF4129 domain-containing protein [Flavobacteriaceae bacterium]
MIKATYIHIILIVCCFTLSASGNALDHFETPIVQDSLKIDDSDITPRSFDNLKEKYADDEFIYERSLETSGWWTRFKNWLSEKFRNLFNFKNKEDAAKAADVAIKIAGILLFLFALYFIFRAILNKEGNWVFGKSSDKSIIPITDIENNIHAVDFNSLITSAEKEHNYRLAVRYFYLWLLKDLTAAELIEYDVEKTNSDYYNELSSDEIKEDFAYTSYLYNYIWYGQFDVDKEEFAKAKHAFINFLNKVKV